MHRRWYVKAAVVPALAGLLVAIGLTVTSRDTVPPR